MRGEKENSRGETPRETDWRKIRCASHGAAGCLGGGGKDEGSLESGFDLGGIGLQHDHAIAAHGRCRLDPEAHEESGFLT